MNRNVTIHDLARIAQVDASTVSRALRGDARVKASTRSRIEALARETGYQLNISARNLAAGKCHTVWMLLPSIELDIERRPATVLSQLLAERGIDLLLLLHGNHDDTFLRLATQLRGKVTDAVVIIPPGDVGVLAEVDALPLPVIYLDRWLPGTSRSVVTSDHDAAVCDLADHVLACGARKIVLYFASGNPVGQAREVAARAFFEAHGVPVVSSDQLSDEDAEIGVLAGSAGAVPHAYLRAKARHAKFYGGFFDRWESFGHEIYQRIFVCRQDFDAIAREVDFLLSTPEEHGYIRQISHRGIFEIL